MKSIEQMCLESFKQECIKEYFGKRIEIENWHRDYILENLNTHDSRLLINKLKKELPVKSYEIEDRGDVVVYFRQKLIGKLDKVFKNILDFYGYYTTYIEWTENGFKYTVCPTYSKNCSRFIYGECYGVCYHICKTEKVESILKKGLRCKTGDSGVKKYREFPERVFVIAVPIKEMSNLNKILKEVTTEIGISDPNEYSVLRINKTMNGHNHGAGPDFYQDDAMKHPNTFFTYTSIPPAEIKNQGLLTNFLN